MSSIRLQIINGTYDNNSAYANVLTYISKKHLTGGYGYYPLDINSVIFDFEQSKCCSQFESPRNLWHFILTFSPEYNHLPDYFFMGLANQIAFVFCRDYQVYYGLDKDTDNPHIHFAVNAYSYHPDTELLSDLKMEHISHYILSELQRIFPNVNVRLAYSKEDQ